MRYWLSMDVPLTLDEKGAVISIEMDGISFPADFSFATVNAFVGNAHYEELQSLCLSMATEIERLQRALHAQSGDEGSK